MQDEEDIIEITKSLKPIFTDFITMAYISIDITKTSLCNVNPLTRKIGVYKGIHYFLIFALKHILCVLVRIA